MITISKPLLELLQTADSLRYFVDKYLMNLEIGFGRRLLQILEEEEIPFEHTPSGIDNLSVIIRSEYLTREKRRAYC